MTLLERLLSPASRDRRAIARPERGTRSLRGQLVRAAMLTTTIALLASSLAVLVYELSTYRNAWIADLRTQADLISRSTEAALVFNDPREAERTLAVLRLQGRIRAAEVFDSHGRPFAWYAASPDEPAPDAGAVSLAHPGTSFDGAMIEIVYPIVHDEERVGTLYLRATHDIVPRLEGYALILSLVCLGALGLAYRLFGRLLTRVTAPLARMTEVAQQVMASRNWRLRAPETEYADIAVLVRAFNGMLAESQARTGELEAEMAERERAEQGLRVADRRKDEFLATLAHELRNPLAPMSNALALLRASGLPEPAREKARDILDRQLRHMVRLIDDLLDVSRVTTGKLSLHRQWLDLSLLLQQTAELAQSMAEARGLSLSVDLQPPGVGIPVDGDPARLAQVFSNLLNNACRYTESGGRITMSARCGGGEVEVRITDTGIGIDPSMQERIFELFEQADKSLGRGSAGLGIGLTLARQLVQLHGGDIRVQSEGIGRGSTFIVRLPLVPDAAAPFPLTAGPRRAASPAAGPSSLDLLVADDNLDFTTSLSAVLETLGHRVRIAGDGATALAEIARHPPDVALLDIGMPGLDGYELARRLRADPATRLVRLVAITGWGQSADREAAHLAGFDRHLVKPVATEELLDVLESMRHPVA